MISGSCGAAWSSASAHARTIDVSAFEAVAGEEHDTVAGNKFWFGITVIGGEALLSIAADAANT